MVNKAEEENDKDHHSVIDAKVIKVPPHAGHGFGVIVWKRDEGVVKEHAPWAACCRLGSSERRWHRRRSKIGSMAIFL